MKEGVATAILRLEPVAEVVPTLDGMNRFILDDLLKDAGGGVPIDRSQHEKTSVEPGRKQMDEVIIDWLQLGMGRDQRQQHLAHAHQQRRAAGRQVEASHQLLSTRLRRRVESLELAAIPTVALIGADRKLDRTTIRAKPVGE